MIFFILIGIGVFIIAIFCLWEWIEKKEKVINKIQKTEKDGIITRITDPDGHTVLMIVRSDQFSMLENDKTSIHYCTIIGDVVHISSKAKYRTVKIHYATDPVC